MRESAVVRPVGGRLAWYPPGAGDQPQWLDDDAVRDSLRATLSQRRIKVCFAVPGADARLLTLAVAPEEKKHLSQSLPFMLEEQVAADIDNLHFAYTALDDDRYAAAVVARAKMQQWQELLDGLPAIPLWMPEPLLLPWQAGEWCLVMEGDCAIVRTGQCEGFTVERELVEPLLQGVLADGEAPQAVVIYGLDQAEDTALLPAELRDRVQWRRGNLCAALMLSEVPAVRVNLLQGEFAPRLPLAQWWQQWRAVAAVFLGACIIQLAAVYAEYRNLASQNLALRTAVEESYRQAVPRGAVVDAEKQLRRQLELAGGSGQPSGFIGLIERVGGAIAGMPGTSIASINYNDKGNEMRLNIVAADFEGVEQLRSRMSEAGLEAVMESSATQGERVSARLRVTERS
ncbi:MAG: type II secretion system protein GspL [Halioglobus sp.]|nr:type II secretion system protein GspL [Halioglobus sp.]